MRCLLLSAYHAQSHAYWCDGVVAAFPQWSWTQLTLPARYFNWRIRGNALSFVDQFAEQLAQPFDLILATSMSDIVGLKGLVPSLAAVPCILYFHENQFDYPGNDAQKARLEPQMMTLFSALAADSLIFNSAYNRQTFLRGVEHLARRLPDGIPKDLAVRLSAKASVLPVPLDSRLAGHSPGSAVQAAVNSLRDARPTLIWNHRWEHDKAPERLYGALEVLRRLCPQAALKVHVVGQQFRQVPPVFDDIKCLLQSQGWLGAWGYQQSRAEYEALLASSHWVLSTALHDFQGLAVLEAASLGARPILPQRLAYPEWFSAEAAQFYPSFPQQAGEEAQALGLMLARALDTFERRGESDTQSAETRAAVSALSWDALRGGYQALFSKYVAAAQ